MPGNTVQYGGSNPFGAEIDLSEQATLAADQLIGRKNGAGTGVPQAMSLTEALTLLGGGSAPTGTGVMVRATSPALVTPNLGTPTAGVLTSCTGLPVGTGVSGLGANVATALAVAVGSAGATVVNGGALGTPTSGSLAACTGGKQVVEAHTGDDTLTAAESGSMHTNEGASGAVILTLPAATGSGVWFDFVVLATQTLTLEPNDADDVIYLNASITTANTGTLSVGTIGRAVRIVDAGSNKWVGISQVGAWTAS